MNTPTKPAAADQLKHCASCGRHRGNQRKNWHPITRGDGSTRGWTCGACPRADEPIRRWPVKGGRVRWRAVLDVSAPGEPRKQQTRTFEALEDARAWVQETRASVEAAAAQGRAYVDGSTLTVRQLADRWLERRAQDVGTSIREVTLSGYRSALVSLLALVGDRPAREITVDEIETALRSLGTEGGRQGRGLSHRSLSYAVVALRQVLAYGVRQRCLKENVATEVTVRGVGARSRRSLRWSVAELRRFREYVDGLDAATFAAEPWIVAGMRLSLCGLRRSEVLGVDWQSVDLDAGTVKVQASRVKTGHGSATEIGRTKTDNSERTVRVDAIHPGTVAALRTLWLRQGRPEAGLVICDALGTPLHPDTFSRRFKAL